MSENYDYKEVGARIRLLRGKSRQKDWASKIGCDQGYISQVENGVTKPSLAFLGSVSGMTSASIDWILSGRGSHMLSNPGGESGGAGIAGSISNDLELVGAVERIVNASPSGRGMLIALSGISETRLRGLNDFVAED